MDDVVQILERVSRIHVDEVLGDVLHLGRGDTPEDRAEHRLLVSVVLGGEEVGAVPAIDDEDNVCHLTHVCQVLTQRWPLVRQQARQQIRNASHEPDFLVHIGKGHRHLAKVGRLQAAHFGDGSKHHDHWSDALRVGKPRAKHPKDICFVDAERGFRGGHQAPPEGARELRAAHRPNADASVALHALLCALAHVLLLAPRRSHEADVVGADVQVEEPQLPKLRVERVREVHRLVEEHGLRELDEAARPVRLHRRERPAHLLATLILAPNGQHVMNQQLGALGRIVGEASRRRGDNDRLVTLFGVANDCDVGDLRRLVDLRPGPHLGREVCRLLP